MTSFFLYNLPTDKMEPVFSGRKTRGPEQREVQWGVQKGSSRGSTFCANLLIECKKGRVFTESSELPLSAS